MATSTKAVRTEQHGIDVVLQAIVVGLTLVTAAVHQSLGGTLFTLNAIGYASLAALLALPGPISRIRWLARLALIGFTLTTIGGWVLFGARFPLAYVDTAVELVLVTLLVAQVWVIDGGPREITTRIGNLVRSIATLVHNRRMA
jgi:hypothetical protein